MNTYEEVYAEYYDTAGNYHWTGTMTGVHVIRKESDYGYPVITTQSEAMGDLISREELLYQLEQYAIASWWLDEDWYKEIVALIKRIDNATICKRNE